MTGDLRGPWGLGSVRLTGALLVCLVTLAVSVAHADAPSQSDYHPSSGRVAHATAELKDGRFLLAGGTIDKEATVLTEIYDPKSNAFVLAGRMRQARYTTMPYRASLASVVLDDGRVVIAGGWVRPLESPLQTVANSPDIWDPATGQWNVISGLRVENYEHVNFNKLDDGRVLFFVSQEMAEKVTFGYRAVIWDPRSDSIVERAVRAPHRLGAAVTVLRDGRVLILGGQATASSYDPAFADIWDSHDGRVQKLSIPRSLSDQRIHSQQLRNGNVLLANADFGLPASLEDASREQPSREHPSREHKGTVWIWNSQTQAFVELPRLDTGIDWPITERRDGSLIAFRPRILLRLQLGANAWEALGYPPQDNAVIKELPAGQLLALSSTYPQVTLWNEAAATWDLRQESFLPMGNPAVVDLGDSVAVVGDVFGGGIGVQTWNLSTGAWRVTPSTRPDRRSLGLATRLSSGKVLILSRAARSRVRCDIFHPEQQTWSDCGEIPPENGENLDHRALGHLDEGRVAFISGPNNAKVFDEATGSWTTMKAEWSKTALRGGEAVRSVTPVLRLFDSRAGQWIDANEVGGKYRGSTKLWDRSRKRWGYVANSGMSKNAFWLPDGCAIAGFPFTLYNPTSGAMTPLDEPVRGFRPGVMTVLSDGTVVAIGATDGVNRAGFGVGYFKRRASCAGFDDPNRASASKPAATSSSVEAENPSASASGGIPLWLVLSVGLCLTIPFVIARSRARSASPFAKFLAYGGIGISTIAVLTSSFVTKNDSVTPTCRFIGRWTSTAEADATVTLQADGKYVYHSKLFPRATGTWELQGNRITWRHKNHEGVLDVNEITDQTKSTFTLKEQNGSDTVFERITPPAASCAGSLQELRDEAPEEIARRVQPKSLTSEPDPKEQLGYEYARQNAISSHADCKRLSDWSRVSGCHRYVREQRNLPPYIEQGNWDSGKTSAQCEEEVTGYWDAVIREHRETRGLTARHAASLYRSRSLELGSCTNYDANRNR